MMLSPSTITCWVTFCPFAKTIFHPVVSGAACNVYVRSVESPASFFPVTVYVPATSFNEMGAAAGATGAGAGAGAAATPVSAGGLSDFEQATAKTMELSKASRRINSSEWCEFLRQQRVGVPPTCDDISLTARRSVLTAGVVEFYRRSLDGSFSAGFIAGQNRVT